MTIEEQIAMKNVRAKQKNTCQWGGCGKTHKETSIHVHHILSREDHPELCAKHPNYLGDFGYINEWDLFYISGAATPKWAQGNFMWGISWWPEEELGLKACNEALDLYEKSKPRIVVSHDCPNIAGISMMTSMGRTFDGSSTSSLLQAMFDIHQPSFWFFGHYHKSRRFKIHKTVFRCIEEAETVEIDV